jgi:hypothetical protein
MHAPTLPSCCRPELHGKAGGRQLLRSATISSSRGRRSKHLGNKSGAGGILASQQTVMRRGSKFVSSES